MQLKYTYSQLGGSLHITYSPHHLAGFASTRHLNSKLGYRGELAGPAPKRRLKLPPGRAGVETFSPVRRVSAYVCRIMPAGADLLALAEGWGFKGRCIYGSTTVLF